MRILPCILFCVLLLSACRKEKSSDARPETCGYAPYTVGSTYNYEYVSGSDSFLYTLTVTGDTILNGKRFSILNSGAANQYIGCDNGRYYLFEQGISLPNYQTADGFRLFLYDYKEVGAGWSDTIHALVSGQDETALLTYTILQNGGPRTIQGQTFANVIGVRQDAAVLSGGTSQPIGTIATYYYAKDIGYIQAISSTYTISLRGFNKK